MKYGEEFADPGRLADLLEYLGEAHYGHDAGSYIGDPGEDLRKAGAYYRARSLRDSVEGAAGGGVGRDAGHASGVAKSHTVARAGKVEVVASAAQPPGTATLVSGRNRTTIRFDQRARASIQREADA